MKTAQHSAYVIIIVLFLGLVASVVGTQVEAKNPEPEVTQLMKEAGTRYPDAGAVILLKEGRMSIGKAGLYNITVHVVGKILDAQAASDYGQICIYFNSYYEEVTLDFAHTIRRDGKIIELSKDAIQLRNPGDARKYTDTRILTFSLPALEAGSVFEYQARFDQRKPIIENRWQRGFNLNYVLYKFAPPYTPRIDPVCKSKFILEVPEGEKFIYHIHRASVVPVIEKKGGFTTYTWEVKDLPAVPMEDYMPPDMIPEIELSSLENWGEVDQWASGHYLSKLELTEEIKAKAQEITKGAETEREKIEAIFCFIQRTIEYIQADLNRGGYIPHPASEVLRNRYGDCKDQVILFIAMLRAVGITAYPALINPYPYSETNREVPSTDFSHLISYVPGEGGDLWLDTTSRVTEFPRLHWSNQDRWALIIDGKGGKFLKIPPSKPEDNQGTMKFGFHFEDEILKTKCFIS